MLNPTVSADIDCKAVRRFPGLDPDIAGEGGLENGSLLGWTSRSTAPESRKKDPTRSSQTALMLTSPVLCLYACTPNGLAPLKPAVATEIGIVGVDVPT